jgi:hypothetical protein
MKLWIHCRRLPAWLCCLCDDPRPGSGTGRGTGAGTGARTCASRTVRAKVAALARKRVVLRCEAGAVHVKSICSTERHGRTRRPAHPVTVRD